MSLGLSSSDQSFKIARYFAVKKLARYQNSPLFCAMKTQIARYLIERTSQEILLLFVKQRANFASQRAISVASSSARNFARGNHLRTACLLERRNERFKVRMRHISGLLPKRIIFELVKTQIREIGLFFQTVKQRASLNFGLMKTHLLKVGVNPYYGKLNDY